MAATRKFATATYGSEAYDLNRVIGFGEEVTYGRPGERTKEEPKTITKAKPRAAAKPVGVSLFAVVGIAVSVVLMVCVLLSYVQLTEISSQMTETQNRITELKKEEARLTIDYEKAFNLSDVENYAVNELNMTKLSAEQIVMVDVDRADKAEILKNVGQEKAEFLSGTAEFISSLMAYFG